MPLEALFSVANALAVAAWLGLSPPSALASLLCRHARAVPSLVPRS